MVVITNGVKTFKVPAGAVKPYEGMGFRVVSDSEAKSIKSQQDKGDNQPPVHQSSGKGEEVESSEIDVEKSEEDAYIEELLEKPLSQWSNDEVKEFVRIKEIDTTGAQKISQVRVIIKNYLEEQSKNA